ncbi:MAG: hypothetical protein ACRDX8_12050, partial [Acidimicrobiales bacterium]
MNAPSMTSARQVKLERLALTRHGLVTVQQAAELRVSHRQLATSPRWIRVRVGLYRLSSYVPTHQQDLMAAVLAAGAPAVVSHRAAAGLHRLDGARGGIV